MIYYKATSSSQELNVFTLTTIADPISVYLTSAKIDEPWLEQLETHLSVLEGIGLSLL